MHGHSSCALGICVRQVPMGTLLHGIYLSVPKCFSAFQHVCRTHSRPLRNSASPVCSSGVPHCRAVTYHGRIIVYGGAVQDNAGAKERLGDVYSLVVAGAALCWSQCDSPAPCEDMPRSKLFCFVE